MSDEVRTIRVEALARVEGEGRLHVRLQGQRIEHVRLEIFEPPRFFEAFLRGRSHLEVPDITARICGICPVAYQMSSVHALEAALGLELGPELRALRRLLYCGEWIESHVLHAFLLHAPDFLGYPDAARMAADHRDVVQLGLGWKKTGNALVELLGGRAVHPVNVRVGGFYRAPRREELLALVPDLRAARQAGVQAVAWAANLPYPARELDVELVSLSHPDEYPMNEGRVVSSAGLDIPVEEFDEHFEEVHVQHSNALQARRRKGGGHYLTGPIARYSLNFDRLLPVAKEAARAAGLGPVCRNPYQSLVVRLVEALHATEEALQLIAGYQPPPAPYVSGPLRAGEGRALTEAPRGSLYHRYKVAADGAIEEAVIVPPTSQNQASIEDDLRGLLERRLPQEDDLEVLRQACELTIRNYDPCISCATHFLRLDLERT
ncbi:MAG: Ni/Fe hydrogenase subunit alpha [Planctomycetota bacterium]